MDPITIALLVSGLAGGLGSVLSSGLQLGSQAWSQDFNAKEAEKSRQFSHDEAILNRQFEAEQAELNRQWQTDMSNTAYQRGMADLQAAGLNPNLLSGGAMGASTGSSSVPQGSQGSSASASSGALGFNNMFTGLSNALNAYATIQNQKLIAQMYNATSQQNNFQTNAARRYGVDVTSANFQNSIWKYRKPDKNSNDSYLNEKLLKALI